MVEKKKGFQIFAHIVMIAITVCSIAPFILLIASSLTDEKFYQLMDIPYAVIEAARIDGANEFNTLYSVVLLMAVSIIATLSLLVGLAYWNDWMNGLYYINDDKLYSIQVLLMNIQRSLDSLKQSAASGGNIFTAELPSTAVRMAITVMGILPVMIVYPFFQKYFVKGIAIGAVKG